jgi:hypothetical protein
MHIAYSSSRVGTRTPHPPCPTPGPLVSFFDPSTIHLVCDRLF